ncbi:sodium-dependent dicarboxylate transporter 2/3/5 [Tamaricihabitans halophyticus]|uniref:Sodium-dependent dicarboxylate transporter SdcS n=1 Tax=Tamaricihabitans halophyticus TaxID=1262583 RepID=A0A4R2R3G2_9PSEU|nr:DASS family sodium-coupled anion symporter [Tamaricihabitans halophyticus]TCP56394.1 sodium-dependent dicarboxylate transporter 2/3/5 [Tamaricihabitans halophyticus]
MTNETAAAPVGGAAADTTGKKTLRRKRIGLLFGILAAVAVYLALPAEVPGPARSATAITALMAVWWMTEALPLAATALVPLVLLPLFGVGEMSEVASPYAAEVVFLLMGGYMLGQAMQRWNLHRRLALLLMLAVGDKPVRMIGGFMLATAFISMWVSNAASTVMMLPIGLSVLGLVKQQLGEGKEDRVFGTALMLGIAFAATIGGFSTLIGSTPNALIVGYLEDNHGIRITFLDWMLFGVPITVVFGLSAWLMLTKVLYRPRLKQLPGGRDLLRTQLAEMGPVSPGERRVIGVFLFAALSWIFVPVLADTELIGGALPWLANVTDAGIAMTVALLLFLIPVDRKSGSPVLDWDSAKELPWGMLLLVGGGLSISGQLTDTGMTEWFGEQVTGLAVLPTLLIIAIVAIMVMLLTELTSNTATSATFIPIMGGVALGIDVDVLVLVLPVTLAAQMSFMLPVATPPNAMVYGTGYVSMGQLIRGGAWLNVIGLLIIMLVMSTIAPMMFNFSL